MNKLSEEEEESIESFLERSDITYTTPGRRDTVYVGMDGDKREYKQERYLIQKLRNLLEIINGSKIIINENFPSLTEAFEHELSFRQMLNFLKMHKEKVYYSYMPLFLSLCQVWKLFTFCSRSSWNTHIRVNFKGLHACKLSWMFKIIWLSLSDFKANTDLISFLQ